MTGSNSTSRSATWRCMPRGAGLLTSDLLMVLEAVNRSLDDIERHLNRAYMETWRYIQVESALLKSKIYREHTKRGDN